MALSGKEKELASKVENKLKKELSTTTSPKKNDKNSEDISPEVVSKDYDEFKQENMPKQFGLFEKACKISEGIMTAPPDKEIKEKLEESIETCHLKVTPESATGFVYVGSMAVLVATVLLGGFISMLMFINDNTRDQAADFFLFGAMMGLILAMMAFFQIRSAPINMANRWRMKASNNMIICVFYIVTFMRHSSNLENGLRFAAEHVGFPLSLDLKRVIWNMETGEYSSITESMDAYLEGWKEYAPEFVESVRLIESSLLQGSEERRIETLDKALSNILEQTYEKMLHYAHNLQGPLSNLNMLGVILPVLGMVILPLVVSMMDVEWYYLVGLYNIILFIAVFSMGTKILNTRPNGYGDTTEENAKKKETIDIDLGISKISLKPSNISFIIVGLFLLIAFSPMIINNVNPDFDQQFSDYGARTFTLYHDVFEEIRLLDYRTRDGRTEGPFGILATLASLGFTLAAGLGLGLYYKLKSSDVIKIKQRTKKLEDEFAGSLFQLGNRLEDGYPTEIALGKVSETLEGSPSGEFFKKAADNIQRLGMDVEDAIFNENTGAIKDFPSSLIASTMKVLVESAKRGPTIAAQAMVNVSTYIKEIHKVDERLRDLMSETLASMKSQIKMLTPLISAIVVGITSLIIQILGHIAQQGQDLEEGVGGAGGMAADMFGEGIPTYYFQIVVGIYVVQIVYLLTKIVNGIENGSDKMSEDYQMGINLTKSTLVYTFITGAATLGFTLLAIMILID